MLKRRLLVIYDLDLEYGNGLFSHLIHKENFLFDIKLKNGRYSAEVVFDLENEYEIDTDEFASMGKCTPFENEKVFGRCIATVSQGRLAYLDKSVATEG